MTGIRLGKRTRRRGALDKAISAARARAARLAASPPLAPTHVISPRASEQLRTLGRSACLVVDCDASAGGSYEACERLRADIDASHAAESPLLVVSDVFVHEAQVRRARVAGADAIVLVARILPLDRLDALARAARDLGLLLVIEVRNEADLAAAAMVSPDALSVATIDRDTRREDPGAEATEIAARATGLVVLTSAAP
ncbi:MAG: hypothetical protein HOV80_32055 [Polyangiaceae bacterium]|nr:hypothetical protein [Polyangiaceae bacterium]